MSDIEFNSHAKSVRVLNSDGIHARPSAQLHKAGELYECQITVTKGDEEVQCRIMGLMMLAAAYGEELLIRATGKEAKLGLDAVVDVIHRQLFASSCYHTLHHRIHSTATTDPIFLAKAIARGDITRNEPNDLFYWLERNQGEISTLDAIGGLSSYLTQLYIVAKNPVKIHDLEWPDYRVSLDDTAEMAEKSQAGELTVKLEREKVWLIKFGSVDLRSFKVALTAEVERIRKWGAF